MQQVKEEIRFEYESNESSQISESQMVKTKDSEDSFSRKRSAADLIDYNKKTHLSKGFRKAEQSIAPMEDALFKTTCSGRKSFLSSSGDLFRRSFSNGGEFKIPLIPPTLLSGHASEVYTCAWNPVKNLLASGSSDSTVRIWKPDDPKKHLILRHSKGKHQGKDVTRLDWNHDGSILATGNFDGTAYLWTETSSSATILKKHKGPIFALKWNKWGSCLLTGGVDTTTIVWDSLTKSCIQQFKLHKEPVLDVDWRSSTVFASSSVDKTIQVCQLGFEKPWKTFRGHTDEVNTIEWSPDKKLLASGSDDKILKVWSLDKKDCLRNLQAHKGHIYSINWSPTGPGSVNPNLNLLLASASSDSTVGLWDVEKGLCVHNLARYPGPVMSIAFSPDGLLLATGGYDSCVHIWSTQSGQLMHTYRLSGRICEVCWNLEGDKLAACTKNGSVFAIELRQF